MWVTILDLAQAIYGFTSGTQETTFSRVLKNEEIQRLKLTENYRNRDPKAVDALNDAPDFSMLAEDPQAALPEIQRLMLSISDSNTPREKAKDQSLVDYYSERTFPPLRF